MNGGIDPKPLPIALKEHKSTLNRFAPGFAMAEHDTCFSTVLCHTKKAADLLSRQPFVSDGSLPLP
ncbi:hypothetical protein CHM34_07815 [Paludifilum halophilum]|uniref:Uncharacterized protein n=1 Tax=Paludifilum halophilum TaxID=1642702 RepID=A0A235B6T5_9BACL|nr:hypothetical protein CHM34_07815 [Paludifilum halophilum]